MREGGGSGEESKCYGSRESEAESASTSAGSVEYSHNSSRNTLISGGAEIPNRTLLPRTSKILTVIPQLGTRILSPIRLVRTNMNVAPIPLEYLGDHYRTRSAARRTSCRLVRTSYGQAPG